MTLEGILGDDEGRRSAVVYAVSDDAFEVRFEEVRLDRWGVDGTKKGRPESRPF